MTDLQARDLTAPDRSSTDFHDELRYARELPAGLSEATVAAISAMKDEPAWMLNFRLRALLLHAGVRERGDTEAA